MTAPAPGPITTYVLSVILALVIGIRPVRTIPAPQTGADAVRLVFAHDDQFEYLGTPAGLYRSRKFVDPAEPAALIAFPDRAVHAVAVDANGVYVLLGDGFFATSTQPTLMRSVDHGQSFDPIDAALADCADPPCHYLTGHHIEFAGGAMFVEIGGNLLVTRDAGLHWTSLYGISRNGIPSLLVCPLAFTVAGLDVYIGSECPLDEAWIARGSLNPDLQSWAAPPVRFDLPLGNRNVQFIRETRTAGVVAGVEGALIAPDRYLIRYESSGTQYPYFREFVESSVRSALTFAGGFDKARSTAYLAMSTESPPGWNEISYLLPPGTDNVAMLGEAADGTLLVALQDAAQYTIAVIDLYDRTKRRAVRR